MNGQNQQTTGGFGANPRTPAAAANPPAAPAAPAANPAAPAAPPANPAPAPAPAPVQVGPSGFTKEQDDLLKRKARDVEFLTAAAKLAEKEMAEMEALAQKVTARNVVAERCKQTSGAGSFLAKAIGTLLSIAVIGSLFFTPEGQLFAYERLVDFKNALEDATGNIKVGYSGRPEVREVVVKRGEVVKVSIAPGVRYNAVLIGRVYPQTQNWLPHAVQGHEDLGATDFLAFSGEGVVKITTGI